MTAQRDATTLTCTASETSWTIPGGNPPRKSILPGAVGSDGYTSMANDPRYQQLQTQWQGISNSRDWATLQILHRLQTHSWGHRVEPLRMVLAVAAVAAAAVAAVAAVEVKEGWR